MHKILVIAATACLALPAAPALAEQRSITVDYSDLNLTSEKAQKRLTRRIEAAARQVCGFYAYAKPVDAGGTKARACYRQAKADALKKFAAAVEHQHLAAVAEQHRKGG